MKSVKIKLLTLVIIVLLIITIANLYNLFENRSIDKSAIRDSYTMNSEKFIFRKFPLISLKNSVDTSITLITNVLDSTLIIILANTGCSPCQIRELKYLKEFSNKNKEIKLIAILNENDRLKALKLKKITEIDYPIYYTYNKAIEIFNEFDKYPIILLVKQQKVLDCLLPIPRDDEYSLNFYRKFEAQN